MKTFTDFRFMKNSVRKDSSPHLSFIKRLKDHPSREKIKSILQKFNKNEEKDYFRIDANIILNHRPRGPKYDKNNIIIPYSFVGPSTLFNEVRVKKNYSSNKYSRMDSLTSLSSSSHFSRTLSKKIPKKLDIEGKQPQIHYLNNNSLTNIYKEIKNRIKKERLNKTSYKKTYLGKIPRFIRKNISDQEKILTKHLLFNKERERFSKTLLKKSGKEKKQELLINNSDDYIVKNQLIIFKDKTQNIDKKYNSNLWTITLRNPDKNGEYELLGYQNVGSLTEPKYTLFNMNKVTEFSVPPRCKSINNNSKTFKNIMNSGNLEIKGENLLDFEAKKELGFKGKKIYYKPNELDYLKFKEKNKLSVINQEDKLINFGDKVYAENFNEKDYCEDQPLNIKFIKSNVSSYIK